MPDRARSLGLLAEWCARHPVRVLASCVFLALLSGAWAATSMEFHSDRSALVDPTLAWQVRYRAFKEEFANWDDAIVVVDYSEASPDEAISFMRWLDAELEESGDFPERALWFDPSTASPAAILLETPENISKAVRELRASLPLLNQGVTLADTLTLARRLNRAPELEAGIRAVRDGADSVLFHNASDPELFTVGDTMAIGFVALDSQEGGGSVNDVARSTSALRRAISMTRAGFKHSGLEIGVTGIPVIESDETTQSTRDATLASILSLVLIAMLLAFVYRGVLVPLCALGALVIGIAWSFGWLMLGVGHLQVLSVVFTIVLLGLGVDSAIHLIARLELVHPDHDHLPGAIGKAASGVGPGIVTGTLTTSIAFGATALSPFTGVAEMGLIAAGGVVLCTLAILVALTALLGVMPHPERRLRARAGGASRPFAGRLGLWIDRHPGKVFATGGVLVVAAALSATGVVGSPVRYDPDLVALMPPDAEGVVWERRLREADERTPWHAVVVAGDRAEAQRLTRELEASPVVESVGGAAALFPQEQALAEKLALLASLPSTEFEPEDAPVSDAELQTLRRAIGEGAFTDDDLRRIVTAFRNDRTLLASRINAVRTATSVVAQDLPEAVVARFLSPDGAYLLRVYPAPVGDLGPLEPARLDPFVQGVLRLAPQATGPAVQVYESTRVILHGYRFAALVAAIAIFVLLLIDFRSLADALCAALPVIVGLALLLGAMASLGIALNFANTIVMPLLIGIGVDSGVHAVHRWRMQPRDAPAGLAGGTGRAITLTSVTTAIGFACMMIAEHRGVRSLGLVMTMGLMLTWGASVLVLPPVLRLRSRIG